MAGTLELESSLTDRYQTTVPTAVRKALKLGKRDKIRFSIQPDGAVLLTRIDTTETTDPVLGQFLNFIAHDMAAHPKHLQSVNAAWLRKMKSLVADVKFDLNAPLVADGE